LDGTMQQQAMDQRAATPPADTATAVREGPNHARLSQLASTLNQGRAVQRLARMSGGVVQRQVTFPAGVVTHTRNAAETLMGGSTYAVTPAVINGKEIPPSSNKKGLIRSPGYDFHEDTNRPLGTRYQLELHVANQTVSYRMELPTDGPWVYPGVATVDQVNQYLSAHGVQNPNDNDLNGARAATLTVVPAGTLKARIRTHELHHVQEQRDAADAILVPWDQEVQDSKAAADNLTGRGPLELMGDYDRLCAPDKSEQEIADELVARIEHLGNAFHEEDAGKPPVITAHSRDTTGATWHYRVTLSLEHLG
jgi:hypothetical protein